MNNNFAISNDILEFTSNLIEFLLNNNKIIFETYRINLTNHINNVDIKLIDKLIYDNKLYVYVSINFCYYIDDKYKYQQYIGLNNSFDTYISYNILHKVLHYFDNFNSNILSVNIIDNNYILKSNIINDNITSFNKIEIH